MVGVQNDLHRIVESGQVFVNGVVDNFPDAVVQGRAVVWVAEVHSRAFSHGFKAFENLDAACVVIFAHEFTFILVRNGVLRLVLETQTCLFPPLISTARYGV